MVISGIIGDVEEEDCKTKVLELVKMEIQDSDVLVVHQNNWTNCKR